MNNILTKDVIQAVQSCSDAIGNAPDPRVVSSEQQIAEVEPPLHSEHEGVGQSVKGDDGVDVSLPGTLEGKGRVPDLVHQLSQLDISILCQINLSSQIKIIYTAAVFIDHNDHNTP